MDSSGDPPTVTATDVRAVFEHRGDPRAPLTTVEVAEELGCPARAARDTLVTLAERGALVRKQVYDAGDVWWLSDDGVQPTAWPMDAETTDEDEMVGEQFRLFVDSVEEYAIFMLDPEGYVQTWNAGAEAIKGYAEAEIVGRHLSVFYTEDDVADGVPEQNLATARERGAVEDEGWRERKDGSRFWASVTITAVRDEAGDLEGFAKVARDLTDRRRREQALQAERDRFENLVEVVKDYAIFRLDPEGHVESWNQGAERLKGYPEGAILGEHVSTFYTEDDRAEGRPERLLETAAEQGRVTDEGWRVRCDGSRFWASVTITAIYDETGELDGYSKVTRDVSDQKRREDQLTALDMLSRSLITVDTPQAVCDTVVEAAADGLDMPLSVIALYDEESGRLRRTATTERAAPLVEELSVFDPDTDRLWDVFGGDELAVFDDLAAQVPADLDVEIRSGVVAPLGRHGVFVTVFPDDGRSIDDAVDFARVVAADLAAALNHAERQQLVHEREAALERQNETLERLNLINDVVRTIHKALVDATSRAEIERTVCHQLATSGPYRMAWIGREDTAADTIDPVATGGLESAYLEDLSLPLTGSRDRHPAATAVQAREPTAVSDLRSDPPFESWRKEALKRGYRSAISVPLVYGDSVYGVLTVISEAVDTFRGLERQVVEELGETIGHAVNAIESKHALVSDEVLELEFRIRDPEIEILRLVDLADCEFEFDSVVSRTDGTLRVFFTARGATPADVQAFAEESPALADLDLVAETDGECRFECTLTDESLIATLLDYGTVPKTLTASGEEGRVVVDFPHQADVREFVQMLQTKYPRSELTARRTRDRAARTPHEFKAAFEERITDRQREVLQTAYFSGFFDSPRKRTGEEIGESLGVSQPTVNHHLRTCQRVLVGMLYGDGETVDLG